MSIEACPVPLEERTGCPYASRPGGCFSSIHHEVYPKADYKTSVEKQYRELPENKQLVCRWEHDIHHATAPTPYKPPRDEMLNAIARSALRGKHETAA